MKKTTSTLLLSSLLLVGCSSTNNVMQENITKDTINTVKIDLSKETATYKTFVEQQIEQLLSDTENFAKLLKEGNLEEAKKVYPLIRMAYERSEPIAESFGESDQKIDFRLVDFKEEHNTDEGWSGFHKIEQILWEKNSTEETIVYADKLVNDIKELKAKIATVEVTPDMMTTGAVDLLNEVATSKITGEEEVFSHTDLYDFKANIEGAEKIFNIFKDKIQEKDSKLVTQLETNFKSVNDLLDKHKTDDKNYKSYTELTKEDTKELGEAVMKLGEPLSLMSVIMEEN